MEHVLDIFENDAFSVLSLTRAINLIPNMYGRIGDMGLFRSEGVDTDSVGIERENGVLNIIPMGTRGGPAAKNRTGKRSLIRVGIPHVPLEDVVTAASLRGVRGMSYEGALSTVQSRVNKAMMDMKRKHDITREWYRAGALRGTVMDSDGSTVVDIFTLMGINQKAVDFVLGTDATNIDAKITEVKDHIEDNLLGDTMTGVGALCSRAWFSKFVNHKQVKEAYAHQLGVNPNRDDLSDGFDFKGVNFRVYRGKAPDENGNSRDFIVSGDVRFFPMGTNDTFVEYNAPGDMIDTVNMPGQPFYAAQEVQKFRKGVDLYTESDPLFFVRRPGVLVRGHTSN